MKILMKTFAVAAMVALLAGCSLIKGVDFPGKTEIEAIRSEAAAYDSARYIATNVESGNLEETFSFMFKPDGTEIWLDEIFKQGTDGKMTVGSYKYYDGTNVVDQTGATTAAKYTKKKPYDMGTGILLFYVPTLVQSGKSETLPAGGTLYTQDYDPTRLANNKASIGDAKSFTTTYLFDKSGKFVMMTENVVDKSDKLSGYQIAIEDINAVTEIDKPDV
jgi:hypothetical protein